MRARRVAACRADGRLYVLLDVGGTPVGSISSSATVEGRDVPVELYPYAPDPASGLVVLVAPYLAPSTIDVRLRDDGGEAGLVLSCPAERWRSSLTYRLHPDVPVALRGTERGWVRGRLRPSLDRYLRGDGRDVWRVSVTWAGEEAADPRLALLDEHGSPLPAEVWPFERQTGVPAPWGGTLNRRVFSVAVPEGCRSFVLLAHDEAGVAADGFCSLDERLHRDKEYETWRHQRDARADDELYRSWFAEHRATPGQLDAQHAAAPVDGPLFSIVVPCFESNETYLRELVDSVRAQSYGRWELLLVDASPERRTVRSVTDGSGDARVRRVALEANAGIVGNTNAGIALAQGDYVAFLDHDDLLEPDALFWYARAASSDERPDVLYCDEDLFERRGAWRQPVFKTTSLNVDLLYSHNCVTHLLCVRRALLERIGPSPEDVSGAQDYDLVLRALAAGARFSHVPRVLYHWREHAGSTSGDNAASKPYAVEAGRLALERHMAARGVACSVEEAGHPFVYRVRYRLPDPHPLVSVVIPSRDHADVLRTCVESVFARSTYDRLEVLVVENGSREEGTRALYRELEAAHPGAFSVVDATAEVADGFNYARLVNVGAAAARGEYLLLLNNDTEVISPDFVEEMLGYLQRPEVGVVGAKLYFRDGLTQHAGMLVGPYGAVSHPNQDFPPSREGYLARAVRPGNFSAVTGACQMVRRSVFDEVGGYDESFAVGFNDVDFCFRVREAGYLVTFTPYAELHHYEFVSRGREEGDPEKMVRWERERARFAERWPRVFRDGDPYTNPNLDRDSFYYGL